MKNYRPARKRVEVSVGESVRILRELQELSQSQLSGLTGIPQATISAIENGQVNLGVERAKARPQMPSRSPVGRNNQRALRRMHLPVILPACLISCPSVIAPYAFYAP